MSFVLKKKTIPKILKDLTWSRWVGDDIAKAKCLCCGVNEIKMNSFHCGHVISEADGGPTTVDNLRPVCATCNQGGPAGSSLSIADGHIRASTTIGGTAVSVSIPVSSVVQTVRGLFTS